MYHHNYEKNIMCEDRGTLRMTRKMKMRRRKAIMTMKLSLRALRNPKMITLIDIKVAMRNLMTTSV